MAIRTINRNMNTRTGVLENEVQALASGDVISGVALRDYIQSGLGDPTSATVTANPGDTTVSLTGASNGPAIGSVSITDGIGTEYTFTEPTALTLTFSPQVPAGQTATISYSYYTIDSLINDIKVRPTNVTATITNQGVDIILLKNGPKGGFSQKYSITNTSATVNDVVAAILTE